MRLKSFHAKSMAEAMQQVRDTLGEDALIVNSREEKNGWVKVTAAIEKIDIPVSEKESNKNISIQKDTNFTAKEIVEIITDTMLRHRVPSSVSEKIIAVSMTLAATDPKKALSMALKKTFSFEERLSEDKPLILVGPPGAGKTLMTAKLAARAVFEDKKPGIITTDIARAGGIEQLSAFLNILSLPLGQASNAKELKSALKELEGCSPIIIDTGGLNPFDPKEMKELIKLLNVTDMTPALVLPAGIDSEESAEIAMTFEVIGIKHLIPTRLDFSRHFGGILSAAKRAGLSFTEGSHTPEVADGILEITPKTMTDLLIPHSPKKG